MTTLLPALVLGPLLLAAVVALIPRWAPGLTIAGSGAGVLGVAAVAEAVHRDGTSTVELAGWPAPQGIELFADALAVVMLGLTVLVGLAVCVYATGTIKSRGGPAFWPLWLALWSALNAVYLSADLFNLYVALEIMGIAAVAMVALGGTASLRPALRYLFVAVIGSLFFLLAVALVYGETGTLAIAGAAESIEPNLVGVTAFALIVVGMALKTALAPLHAWLPAAHGSAPSAVSALLSAVVVKASFYIIVRLWSEVFVFDTPLVWGLGGLGAFAIVWGSIQALRHDQIKVVVAYSTVAQVGYLFLLFPLFAPAFAEDAGDGAGAAAWTGILALVVAHGIAKTAMFLAAGNLINAYGDGSIEAMRGAVSRMPASTAAFAIAGISLAGLPPTFGFVGKWQLLQASLETGQRWWLPVLLVGGLLTFAYTARVVSSTFAYTEDAGEPVDPGSVPRRTEVIALALAVVSVVMGLASLPLLTFVEAGMPGGGA